MILGALVIVIEKQPVKCSNNIDNITDIVLVLERCSKGGYGQCHVVADFLRNTVMMDVYILHYYYLYCILFSF